MTTLTETATIENAVHGGDRHNGTEVSFTKTSGGQLMDMRNPALHPGILAAYNQVMEKSITAGKDNTERM